MVYCQALTLMCISYSVMDTFVCRSSRAFGPLTDSLLEQDLDTIITNQSKSQFMPQNVPHRPDPRVNCMVIYSEIPAHLLTHFSYKGAYYVSFLLCKSHLHFDLL